ncbi:sporozoite invasion-associated protein 1, putative [Babesia caballi]|uniref:Sporozoite invasion-associated protein 1, putative n=1 Tax=Babesia caballi TaxID=5871 RepID=A0AAV4M200_BABCB|nr:sporozoite invasion-associated protein 1, putative [Babesia caballi]
MEQRRAPKAAKLLMCAALALAGVANAYQNPLSKNTIQQLGGEAVTPEPQTPRSPTFAEMGVFLEPKMIPDEDGNTVVSFLHTAPTSANEAHDVITMRKNIQTYDVVGEVVGLMHKDPVTVILGTMLGSRFDILFEAKVTQEQPAFRFQVPKGRFYIKVEASGYRLPGVTPLRRPCKDQAACPFSNPGHKLEIQPMGNDKSVYEYEWQLQEAAQYGVESLSLINDNEASVINASKPGIDATLDYSDAAAKLRLNYGIELHGAWGSEYASRLLGVVSKWEWYKELQLHRKQLQKWVLTDEALYPMDVSIVHYGKPNQDGTTGPDVHQPSVEDAKYSQVVTLSRQAFTFANRRAVEKDRNKRIYFSRRLHKAVLRATCVHDPEAMRKLFFHMHDVQLLEPHESTYRTPSGRQLSQYPYTHYQTWFKHPEELVEIATTWREYPDGLQKIKGLKYLLRRRDGMVNPEEPTAPAIAYPRGPKDDSYIEFMESAFHNYPDIPSLVIHELAHFVHANVVSPDLYARWREVGGWFRDPNDPDGWSTHQQTQFVNAYGHKKNPEEDFATCLSDYVLNPRRLQSRAPLKYDYMRNNVMNGAYYVTRASHEFQVLNLGNPDFMYPGRITNIKVRVTGQVNEDKRVEFEIQLANNGENSCAIQARFRLFSTAKTYTDVILSDPRCSHTLRGSIVINRTQKRGVWTTDQIVVADNNRLQRYVGAADFGLRVWVDNGAEDFQEPRAIVPSIAVNLINDRDNAIIRATWLLADDGVMRKRSGAFASVYSKVFGQHTLSNYADGLDTTTGEQPNWRQGLWTGYREVPARVCNTDWVRARESSNTVNFNKYAFDEDAQFNGLDRRSTELGVFHCYQVSVNIPISSAARSGDYHLSRIMSYDSAGNTQMLQWPNAKGPLVHYQSRSAYEDNEKPQLANVRVESRPTNPRAPNGETVVNFSFDVRDLQSGISAIYGRFRDPFGACYIFRPKFTDSKDWQPISFRYMLPRGSVPGVWHLVEIGVQDKAGNELIARLYEQPTPRRHAAFDLAAIPTHVTSLQRAPSPKLYAAVPTEADSTTSLGALLDSREHWWISRYLKALRRVPPVTGAYVAASTAAALLSWALNDNYPFEALQFDLQRVKRGELWRLVAPFFNFGQLWLAHLLMAQSVALYMSSVEVAHCTRPEKFLEFMLFGGTCLSLYGCAEAAAGRSETALLSAAYHLHVYVLYYWSRLNEGSVVNCLDLFDLPAEAVPAVFLLQNFLLYREFYVADVVAMGAAYLYFFYLADTRAVWPLRLLQGGRFKALYQRFSNEISR